MIDSEVDTLIVGAGLSGLMMGHLMRRNFMIVEAAERPNFDVGTPFYLHAPIDWLPTNWKEIDVHHHCWDGERFHRQPDLKMMNDYSRKIVGKIIDTSLKFMDGSIKRGFVPANGSNGQVLKDLFTEVCHRAAFGAAVTVLDAKNRTAYVAGPEGGGQLVKYKNLVSTLPLPVLLKMLKFDFPHQFQAEPITTIMFDVPAGGALEAFQVVNLTAPEDPFYRASLMDQKMVFETMNPEGVSGEELTCIAMARASELWGFKIVDGTKSIVTKVRPGKFHPIPKTARKMLLGRLTSEFNIFCLGRYAVWDYKRIDHIAHDAQQILKLMKAEVLA